MPELPEVENILRGLASLRGLKVRGIVFKTPGILSSGSLKPSALDGRELSGLRRRGKHLILEFAPDLKMIMHMGMTGQVFVGDNAAGPLKLSRCDVPGAEPSALPDKHTHMVIDFGSRTFYYRDIRKFGFIDILKLDGAALDGYFTHVGHDALEMDPAEFALALKKRRTRIKPLLLSQKPVTGLGNIYVDETLFKAGIHPKKKASALSRAKLAELYDAMRGILQEAIEKGGSSIDDYVRPDGTKGGFQLSHRVYGKEGQPCPQCGASIRKIKLGGRGTSYCPRCQK